MKLLQLLIMLLLLSSSNSSIAQETPTKEPVRYYLDGLPLSLESYPIVRDTTVSEDGKEFPLAYRKPIGDGPFPVVLYFHGGAQGRPEDRVAKILEEATPTRLLKKGYMVVVSTRRSINRRCPTLETENPKSYSGGAIYDGIAAVQKTKTLAGADPASIVIFGASVGGALAIATAAQTTIAAVVVEEPSPHYWMGQTEPVDLPSDFFSFEGFPRFYTKEVRSFVRSVLGSIDCPFLLLHSDPSGFRRTDFLYLMRELQDLRKRAKTIGYAGQTHGFTGGRGLGKKMSEQELDEVIEDIHTFILPHLRTKPKPL